jgi:hypothetical protein
MQIRIIIVPDNSKTLLAYKVKAIKTGNRI